MDMQKCGKFITLRRKELDMTQQELGNRLMVTDKAVSKWERGISCPDITIIKELATHLKVSISELLNGEIRDPQSSSNKINKNEEKSFEFEQFSNSVEIDFSFDSNQFVSAFLFGNNLEHTRSCINSGLSAQMLKNRKFVGKPSCCGGLSAEWYPIGEATFFNLNDKEAYTRHVKGNNMNRKLECNSQEIINFYNGIESGIGQHGLFIQKGNKYEVRVVSKVMQETTLIVCLTDRYNKKVYAKQEISMSNAEWMSHSTTIVSNTDDADADLKIFYKEEGTVILGAISLMPTENFRGMRKDVIDCLKEMGISVLRWPGGNFAGEYSWIDGTLPVDMRAPLESFMGLETQPHSMGYDFHEINTDDFIHLCREINAEPYITINPTWDTTNESAAWVEYCNGVPTSKYGKMRAEAGYAESYNVKFWSLGNEFGYGHMEGNNTPQEYCRVVKNHAEAMLEVSPLLTICSSGPYPNKYWAENAALPLSPVAQLVSMHAYAPSPNYKAKELIKAEFYEYFSSVDFFKNCLYKLRKDLTDDVKISFDEWNTWHAWYRPSNIYDGLFTAMILHMLIGEADRIGLELACHFEAVNEGAIIVSPSNAKLTASGQMFSVMKHHIGGELCFSHKDVIATKKEQNIIITLINRSFDQTKQFLFPICGELISAEQFYAEKIYPHSDFSIKEIIIEKKNNNYLATLQPLSVGIIKARLV